MKCILFIRVSTTKQETESQLKETKEYAESLKYDEFVVLEEKGASAYKVNDLYKKMIERLKEAILADPSIKAVVCWHLNRLARNDEQAAAIKNFLIANKVQLHVKEPGITLLNPDGTVNEGAEMVFSVFSIMSKQAAAELRLKSSRAKTRDKAQHKFLGGRGVFGYTARNKYMVPEEKEAPIVRNIYELYATGNYSFNTLAIEINERYGTNFPKYRIAQLLSNKHYYDGEIYPPIISAELFNKALEVAKNAQEKPKNNKYHYFGAKLIKCPECGCHYIADSDSYRCINRCSRQMVSLSNMDGLLWLIASDLEGKYLLKDESREELLQKKAVLASKIKGVDSCTTKGEKMRQRAKKAYLEGIIELEEYKDRIATINQEQFEVEQKVARWREEIAEIEVLINENQHHIKKVLEISDRISKLEEVEMRDIVRKWVKEVEISNDKIVTVHTLAKDYQLKYSRYNTKSRFNTISGKPLVIVPILRDGNKAYFKPMPTPNPQSLVNTLAWLEGSAII